MVDDSLGVSDSIQGSSRFPTTSSVPLDGDSHVVSTSIQGSSRFSTTWSVPMVDDSLGVSDPSQASRFRLYLRSAIVTVCRL